jgi:predicted ATPase
MSPLEGTVRSERLAIDGMPVFDDGPTARIQPLLFQIAPGCPASVAGIIKGVVEMLSNCQHLDPVPAVLREYSTGREVRRLGDRGENFAALVKTILADEATADAYRSWLDRLTPRGLDDIAILQGALGEPMFALMHHGRLFPAPVLSDGTLRFAALTAAFFQPDMPRTLVLEEIENGIHPSRLRLLVELLRTRSSEDGPQVMASTHSPVVVDWLTPENLEHCFLCRHDEETGVSLIQPVSSLPRFGEIVKRQPAGELFAEGWMESSA